MIEELEQIIRHDITLHEKLQGLILKKQDLFIENNLDEITEKIKCSKQIEAEIKSADKKIGVLFQRIETENINLGVEQKSTLKSLMDNLRERIKSTISTVEQTEIALKKMRKETINELETFDRRKQALNAYSRNI